MLSHHAYYIEGSLLQFGEYKEALRPFWSSAFERFGIDESRELIALSSLKNFKEAVFFVGASSITGEAQQALLKLFEEPQAGTTFVLLVPHGALMPTLKSRMLEYPSGGKGDALTQSSQRRRLEEPLAFLKSNQKKRSELIAAMLKDDEGVKERVRDFINALEAEMARSDLDNKVVREGLEDIAMVRDYLGDRSPSLKMLLEHLALSLPNVNNK